jgi:hypothetical protein
LVVISSWCSGNGLLGVRVCTSRWGDHSIRRRGVRRLLRCRFLPITSDSHSDTLER